ncbi:MAG: response regulator [Lachnospiraceae bacterium]|nr:response regulator [Lachnospiraceae bacterium]
MSKKILVVDDDAMNLKMAEFILKKKDYLVLTAKSGLECLEILEAEDVELVLLDIEMPEMNGMETLEKIRANRKSAGLPVMFLTATVDSESVAAAEKLGASDFIKKPFLPQDLMDRVEKIIG